MYGKFCNAMRGGEGWLLVWRGGMVLRLGEGECHYCYGLREILFDLLPAINSNINDVITRLRCTEARYNEIICGIDRRRSAGFERLCY